MKGVSPAVDSAYNVDAAECDADEAEPSDSAAARAVSKVFALCSSVIIENATGLTISGCSSNRTREYSCKMEQSQDTLTATISPEGTTNGGLCV